MSPYAYSELLAVQLFGFIFEGVVILLYLFQPHLSWWAKIPQRRAFKCSMGIARGFGDIPHNLKDCLMTSLFTPVTSRDKLLKYAAFLKNMPMGVCTHGLLYGRSRNQAGAHPTQSYPLHHERLQVLKQPYQTCWKGWDGNLFRNTEQWHG